MTARFDRFALVPAVLGLALLALPALPALAAAGDPCGQTTDGPAPCVVQDHVVILKSPGETPHEIKVMRAPAAAVVQGRCACKCECCVRGACRAKGTAAAPPPLRGRVITPGGTNQGTFVWKSEGNEAAKAPMLRFFTPEKGEFPVEIQGIEGIEDVKISIPKIMIRIDDGKPCILTDDGNGNPVEIRAGQFRIEGQKVGQILATPQMRVIERKDGKKQVILEKIEIRGKDGKDGKDAAGCCGAKPKLRSL